MTVSYLRKMWFFFICLCVSAFCTAAQTDIKTNLEIVDSLASSMITAIPEADTLHVILEDSSQAGFFIHHCIIGDLAKRRSIILTDRNTDSRSSVRLSIVTLNITYRKLRKKILPRQSVRRNVELVLNLGVEKGSEIVSDSLYTASFCDTISVVSVPYVDQQGRILGKGGFIHNNGRFRWLEPILALLVVSGIGSLFYWVRSN